MKEEYFQYGATLMMFANKCSNFSTKVGGLLHMKKFDFGAGFHINRVLVVELSSKMSLPHISEDPFPSYEQNKILKNLELLSKARKLRVQF